MGNYQNILMKYLKSNINNKIVFKNYFNILYYSLNLIYRKYFIMDKITIKVKLLILLVNCYIN